MANDVYVESPALDEVMYYVLYDLQHSPTEALLNVHLPCADEAGPVLLAIHPEDYGDVIHRLRAMLADEGDFWFTGLLLCPKDGTITFQEYDKTLRNTSDLMPLRMYVVIAHLDLMVRHTDDYGHNPARFFEKIASMRKWQPN